MERNYIILCKFSVSLKTIVPVILNILPLKQIKDKSDGYLGFQSRQQEVAFPLFHFDLTCSNSKCHKKNFLGSTSNSLKVNPLYFLVFS